MLVKVDLLSQYIESRVTLGTVSVACTQLDRDGETCMIINWIYNCSTTNAYYVNLLNVLSIRSVIIIISFSLRIIIFRKLAMVQIYRKEFIILLESLQSKIF